MASIGDLGSALNGVISKIHDAITAAHLAAELAEDARELLAIVGRGSHQADVEETCSLLTSAIDGIREPEGLTSGLGTVADAVEGMVRRLALGPPSGSSDPLPPQGTNAPVQGSPERIRRLQEQLPVPSQRKTGQKTRGRWFAPGCAESEIVSGEGPGDEAVADCLKALMMPRPGLPFAAWHVETKLAVHMRDHGIQHATVVIDNKPCPGDFGCEVLVGAILPAGSTLTIHGSDGYRRTIAGGTRAPWQR
ncbi:DddA-like double-stranded DNA deaminase toxin [Lentzea sp. CA-135723]|uniref:DddA-like double-stranded DNA deaminase toxin n=1 Tax=Lentzea sp. CA-135723 TaxID=3239950 RepID=UPI003D8FF24B